jgi:predicted NBD/HSP70 family sugar kinase
MNRRKKLLKQYKNIRINIENIPELDPCFLPMEAYVRAFEKTAEKQIAIVVIGNDDMVSRYDTTIHGTKEMELADFGYIELIVKFLIWARGGSTIVISDDKIANHIKRLYNPEGKRAFDYHFMTRVYEMPLQVSSASLAEIPSSKMTNRKMGRQLTGFRIGFDAGGSDRKVSAVVDGICVYSEEVIWFPKIEQDPEYHYQEILSAFKTAASKMPRVDAIGVSSAGVYVENKTKIASIFLKVPEDIFEEKVKNIYVRAASEIGDDIPLVVANDGDVTALAGSMSLNVNSILGMAMGTSEAVGYVDRDGNITGWLNELAFAPVDLYEGASVDEWSNDYGVGCKYFSQDAVIKLAPIAGIEIDKGLSLADKLKVVQELMEKGDSRATAIYRSIGVYLGHTIPLYSRFYQIEHVLLMGRVTSGNGGTIIVNTAKKVMEEEYPDVFEKVELTLPDEKSRRVGQSIAAASLPTIEVKNDE